MEKVEASVPKPQKEIKFGLELLTVLPRDWINSMDRLERQTRLSRRGWAIYQEVEHKKIIEADAEIQSMIAKRESGD